MEGRKRYSYQSVVSVASMRSRLLDVHSKQLEPVVPFTCLSMFNSCDEERVSYEE